MKKIIGILFCFLSVSTYAQDFSSDRFDPILEEQHVFFNNAFKGDIEQLVCPPELVDNPIEHFDFLDSIPDSLQPNDHFLSLLISNHCNSLYEAMAIHQSNLPIYKKQLKKVGLEDKYALLPLTVSSGVPTLKYQLDKSGVWQLSYVTARQYGIEITAYYDERNDVVESSRAAAEYLAFLKDYYLNNELLVVCAYYTSVPYVNKRLHGMHNVDAKTFINELPAEVQSYLTYVKAWANYTENFKLDHILEILQPIELKPVKTKDTLNFQLISQFMGVSEKSIHFHNPSIINQTVIPNTKHDFMLPAELAENFESKYQEFLVFQKAEEERKQKELAELKKRMEAGIPDPKKYSAITYVVKSGDVLGKIAEKHSVKVSQIKQWNNLKSDRIDIGQKLIIYVPKGASFSSDHPENKIETKPTKASPGNGSPSLYTVQPGESLWLIARKFPGVSAENIMEWNGITEKINPGMQLKIYNPE